MVLLGDVGQVELISVRLEIVLISAQDRCMVCAECTTGVEIILGTPVGTPRLRVSSGSSFWSVLEIVLILALDGCTVCARCTTGMEINLGTSW
jgi:hypothetical protein